MLPVPIVASGQSEDKWPEQRGMVPSNGAASLLSQLNPKPSARNQAGQLELNRVLLQVVSRCQAGLGFAADCT